MFRLQCHLDCVSRNSQDFDVSTGHPRLLKMGLEAALYLSGLCSVSSAGLAAGLPIVGDPGGRAGVRRALLRRRWPQAELAQLLVRLLVVASPHARH